MPAPEPQVKPSSRVFDHYNLVSRSIQRATPMILRAVKQIQERAARTT